MTTYTCEICDHTKTQKSHITSHLETQKHKKNAKIFRLEMEKLSENELLKQYGDSDIDSIIKKLECVVSKPKVVEKKVPINAIIWRASEVDEVANKQHEDIKSETFRVIKKCHDILYSSSAIVGVKAQNDIMKLLSLKLLEPQFKDESSDLYHRCIELKEELDEEDYENYMSWCQDINNITKINDDKLNEWSSFVCSFLIKILPEIYTENDKNFNYKQDIILIKIINQLSKITINQEFFDAFGSTCGDIHEMFRAYGKSSKELGQFFTPRKLINVIFHGIKDMINPKGTVYDPCMGTAGFLTRIQKLMNIDSKKIYGCEMEPDTAKYGQASIYLNSGKLCPNIQVCNSLSENEYIIKKEFDTIVTNPPFGTKMKYKDLKETYTQMFSEDYEFTFEDAYPINTGNGPCLFLQHCINNLKKGGVCAIVLPAGELFEGISDTMIKIRKWLCKNVDIQSIMKVPGGAFEHTSVKTNVLIFKKNGKTKEVKFLETNDSCTEVKEITTVSYRNIKAGNYNLGVDTYLEKPEAEAYDIPMVELGEICDMKNGNLNSKDMSNEGNIPFYTCSSNNPVGVHTDHTFDYNNYLLIVISGGSKNNLTGDNVGLGKSYIVTGKTACRTNVVALIPKNGDVNIKYLHYWLSNNRQDVNKLAYFTTNLGVIRLSDLQSLKIPLPPIDVQRQIVEELETLDEIIKINNIKIEQIKKEMILYKKHGYSAEIKRALSGCEVKELGEISIINPENMKQEEYTEINYIDISSVKGGKILELQKIIGNFPSRAKRIIKKGDILYSSVRPNLKGYVYINDNIQNGIASTGFANIRIKEPTMILSKYLYYIITGDDINEILISKATGAMYPAVPFDEFKTIKIPIPPIEVQKQIIDFYDDMFGKIAKLEEENNEKNIFKATTLNSYLQ